MNDLSMKILQSKPKKVLLLSLSGIGNFLMQSPVFQALKTAHPDWHLTVWVAPRGTQELVENDPYIDEVIEAPIQQSLVKHVRLIQQLRQQKFNLGVVLYPGQHFKSAAYLLLAGIPQRIGHHYPLRNNPVSSFLFTHVVDQEKNIHDIEQNLRLLEPLHIAQHEIRISNYKLLIPSHAEKKARDIRAQLHISNDKIIIGFHPGSAAHYIWKRWPLEYFAEVGKTLIQKYKAHILIFGSSDEYRIKAELRQKIQVQTPGIGSNKLENMSRESVTLVESDLLTTAAVIRHCQLFISNDSGLMHVAAAVGTPTLGLFGPTDEHRTGPRGDKSFAMRAHGTQPVYDVKQNYNLGTQSHQTLHTLKPALVLEKIKEILDT